jgi:hypothetical protein
MGPTAGSTRDWRESLGRMVPGIKLVASKPTCHACSSTDSQSSLPLGLDMSSEVLIVGVCRYGRWRIQWARC